MLQWLFKGLANAGSRVICIATRHVKAFFKAQPNKTDRNDVRGIAPMMRVNLHRPVHVKTQTSQKRRALLTARKLLQGKAVAIENGIRCEKAPTQAPDRPRPPDADPHRSAEAPDEAKLNQGSALSGMPMRMRFRRRAAS